MEELRGVDSILTDERSAKGTTRGVDSTGGIASSGSSSGRVGVEGGGITEVGVVSGSFGESLTVTSSRRSRTL